MTYINNKNKTAFCLNGWQENLIEKLKENIIIVLDIDDLVENVPS